MVHEIHARRWLRCLDTHRRTVLDLLGVLLLLVGIVTVMVAVVFLYPADDHRLPGADVLAVGSTSIAAGGILLGIGGPRDDHCQRDRDTSSKEFDGPVG